MNLSRALTLFGLVLVLVTGSVAMATARHQLRTVGEVVICSGYGLTSISVDAEGNPTGPRILCPDCVPAFAALTDPALPIAERAGTLNPIRFASREIAAPPPPAPVHSWSRAPPVTA
ncbi:hypothetical protein [Pararhodobacter zhoushanensis]|uniref:DUF2946 domain-containing protein n=1 Tax=Pararhodobacter zhoushanensis TaxID=2479545 RepID=A0ABT3GVG1_9RHOB|nr:hypothetical protein [Pararhodobacter zhoushanensis]MCW1931522.1 hypothetical protein [Pararhodobacter zhoushanensis]